MWVQLEEKQIPYTIETIALTAYGEKPKSYLDKVPNGVVPAIELDGKLFTESAQIAALLEEEFPERPLFPPKGSAEYERATQLQELEG